MTDKTEVEQHKKAVEGQEIKAKLEAAEPKTESVEKAELAAKAEAVKAGDEPEIRKVKKGIVERVLTRKAFINGRLYEPGETVIEEDGEFRAIPKSTPAGDLSLDQAKQLVAKLEAEEKANKAKAQ